MSYNAEKQINPNSNPFEVFQFLQQNFTLNWNHQKPPQDDKREEISQTIKIEFHTLVHLLIIILLILLFAMIYLIIYFICSLFCPIVTIPLYWMLLVAFPSYLKGLSNWKALYFSQINWLGIVSAIVMVAFFKYIKPQQTKNELLEKSSPAQEKITLDL
jgi:ABC-type multidrug transport system permease subunit